MTERASVFPAIAAESIRVRGLVQGVGFRPTVYRLARELGLSGDVRNDGEGVLIRVRVDVPETRAAVATLLDGLRAHCPPLARIESITRQPIHDPDELATLAALEDFAIVSSARTPIQTGIIADAATCDACVRELRDPTDRRFRYPFTNCTHCGPRLSIVRGIPYDRALTSMAAFGLCPECAAEYADPLDRRFHAQPNACARCGPRVWLEDARGDAEDRVRWAGRDALETASRLLAAGRILAIKGIGGFHLACDATHADAVAELRRRKGRHAKPFALMARDLDVIRHYGRLSDREAELLGAPEAPIVLLDRREEDEVAPDGAQRAALANGVAPGQVALGFMLPYSPIHHLLLEDWDRPLVMTSGNLSEEPQCIANADAHARLAALADHLLLHDRDIVNRVDDSVVRLMAGAPRLLRRARGYAPSPLSLPEGFHAAPLVLALGGELKNTVCLARDGRAILSQHLGDLEEAATAREYERTIELYLELFQVEPAVLAVDLHPDYRSSVLGRDWAARDGLTLIGVQHHHAHLASVLAENGWPLDAGPVLGILLDGLGYGEDGSLWGGEFLLGDYRDYDRIGRFTPVAMPGGARAIIEPWRNLVAHLEHATGGARWLETFGGLETIARLEEKPLAILRTMIERGVNAPRSSSVGRLFDAVAAALGVAPDHLSYEGEAAIALEALATPAMAAGEDGYAFGRSRVEGLESLDPAPLWAALLADLARGRPRAAIAAAFHRGLARALAELACDLAWRHGCRTLALSGGVFQNRPLLESVKARLEAAGLAVLLQRQVPANDGGLSLGQAAVASARMLYPEVPD